MTFDSFREFVEQRVLPAQQRNPHHVRLDGKTSGGNREVFGVFRYRGKVWKVHSDTHYEPLLLAYEALASGNTQTPFDEVMTSRSSSACLDLIPSIRQRMVKPRFKYLYIYEA